MIRSLKELPTAVREAIRGGSGRAWLQEMLLQDDMNGVAALSHLTLEPGATIAEHRHEGSEELYIVLSGHGVGMLDGARVTIGPGSYWVVRDGHTHGIENAPGTPLELLALLTRA
jgi:quercetin dioxygenase-like cupin family protein